MTASQRTTLRILAVLGSPLPEDAYRVACGWANRGERT